MPNWKNYASLFLYHRPREQPSVFASGLEDHISDEQPAETPRLFRRQKGKTSSGRRKPRRPRQVGAKTAIEKKFHLELAADQAIDRLLSDKTGLAYSLNDNREVLAKIFRVPKNKDTVLRSLSLASDPPVKALLVFIDGITDSLLQNLAILQPLMLLSGLREQAGKQNQNIFELVKEALLPNNQIAVVTNFNKAVEDILNGNSVLFIDGYNQALSLETRNWPNRGVSPPQIEAVIRGPQEAFTEQLRINIALVRKTIRQASLVTEFVQTGATATLQCAVTYMDDLANPELVQEVKRRLGSIKADFIQETGMLEQMIEDAPFYPAPQVLVSERPDRVAAALMEGKVAVFINGNPFAVIVPATFFTLMQSPEDAYVRWPFGTFTRLIRYAALFLALLLPAHYVAIVAFHQEFIPTDLLLAITGARERVPFPSIVEVLIMELSFVLLREAGLRIPGTVGTTLGIVGALILGQAAVAANIVSPILIIVVAVTAIGTFTIPDYTFSLSIRVLRFAYILLATVMGLLGILVGVFIHLGLLVSLKSFGVPFMAPVAPVTRKGYDYFLRGQVWQQEKRPDYLDPLKIRRQPLISRRWLYPHRAEDKSDKS
ncbi:MAG: spore germination protein [Clostridia bacterium]|nr:spore germination protein [Clostridia bacterium]